MDNTNTRLVASKSRLVPSILAGRTGFLSIPLPTRANEALHKKPGSVSATLQSSVSNHHLLRSPRSFTLAPRCLAIVAVAPSTRRVHRLRFLARSSLSLLVSPARYFAIAELTRPLSVTVAPLLDVCIGSHLALHTSARTLPLVYDWYVLSPLLLTLCLTHLQSSASPLRHPFTTRCTLPDATPIHANHTSLPRLLNPDSSSVNTPVSLRARWMGSALTDRLGNFAVAPASSLRPCLAGFTLSDANSISSLPFPPEVRDSIRQEHGIATCEMDGLSVDGKTWSFELCHPGVFTASLPRWLSLVHGPISVSRLSPSAHGLAMMAFKA
ncbi:hypothetical protein FB45DRAFT_1058335 [Roridomyces roridus]|uniref:Uncharacterized protein n=1 Tax=Roridomyces roridus TaxID=1738132 RepID=A0AAD7BT78_9AGAR|nr:hypothetical protein FB45DRAFT_1058335 [Roridomyces roridus]